MFENSAHLVRIKASFRPNIKQDAFVTSWATRFTSSRIGPGVFNFKWNLDEVP